MLPTLGKVASVEGLNRNIVRADARWQLACLAAGLTCPSCFRSLPGPIEPLIVVEGRIGTGQMKPCFGARDPIVGSKLRAVLSDLSPMDVFQLVPVADSELRREAGYVALVAERRLALREWPAQPARVCDCCGWLFYASYDAKVVLSQDLEGMGNVMVDAYGLVVSERVAGALAPHARKMQFTLTWHAVIDAPQEPPRPERDPQFEERRAQLLSRLAEGVSARLEAAAVAIPPLGSEFEVWLRLLRQDPALTAGVVLAFADAAEDLAARENLPRLRAQWARQRRWPERGIRG